MRMRLTYTLFLLLLAITGAQAQQTPMFSHYTLNYLQINPAVAGSQPCLDMRMGYRRQWTGMPEGPRTAFGNIHGNFGKKKDNFHGIGVTVFTDDAGPLGGTGMNLVYAYHFRVNRKYMLSAGVGMGFTQYRFDVGNITLPDVQLINDPAFDNRAASEFIFPQVQFGLWLYRDDRFYGFAVHNLLENNIGIIGLDSRLVRHYSLAAGYALKMQDGFSFKPSAHLQFAPGIPLSLDMTAMLDYKKKFELGAGFRTQSGIVGLVRFDLFKYVTLGYAYDHALSRIRFNGRHTHEIVLGLKACALGETQRTVPCAAYN